MRTILTTLHSKFIHNTLALPCLAAYCGNDCGELLIREFTVHEPRESILALLLTENPEVIAFSVYLWNRRETLELVDALAAAQPQLRIVLGGPEVSFDSAELLHRHPGITALIHGEGELPLRNLLQSWHNGQEPIDVPRVTCRVNQEIVSKPDGPVLDDLDRIPSPFARQLVDLDRGFVYYETSRGCPFQCSFCLSARDNQVRSYSMERIQSDLRLLMEQKVPKIKLVDRTFNFDAARARDIFRFILAHNRGSHFHFEIAAHLLDEETLDLLEQVPEGMFQFEIGVQSTLESTLQAVERRVNQERLEANVRRLRSRNLIHLHLDLVAGLPNETYEHFLRSIDRVVALDPHHLQIEPVKVLPGSPLSDQATQHQLRYDPNPPYTILASQDLSFDDLQRLQAVSRLVDLLYNSGHYATFLAVLSRAYGSFAMALEALADFWQTTNWLRFPVGRQVIYERCWVFVKEQSPALKAPLQEALAYDYARAERVVLNRIPAFFDTTLNTTERNWVQEQVQARTDRIRGQGIKLQYFAARFQNLPDISRAEIILFFYLTQTGHGMQVEEQRFSVE